MATEKEILAHYADWVNHQPHNSPLNARDAFIAGAMIFAMIDGSCKVEQDGENKESQMAKAKKPAARSKKNAVSKTKKRVAKKPATSKTAKR